MLNRVDLPAPFGPMRPSIFARRNADRDVAIGDEAAEAARQIAGLEERRAHGMPLFAGRGRGKRLVSPSGRASATIMISTP